MLRLPTCRSFCALLFALSLSATAVASPQVFHVQVDLEGHLLTIHGNSNGLTPGLVKLAKPMDDVWVQLEILFWSPELIQARLPADIVPGTYRRRVAAADNRAAFMDLTIGAVGPPGPEGRRV